MTRIPNNTFKIKKPRTQNLQQVSTMIFAESLCACSIKNSFSFTLFSVRVSLIICRERSSASVIYANNPVLFRQASFRDERYRSSFLYLEERFYSFCSNGTSLKFHGMAMGNKGFLHLFLVCSTHGSETILASFLLVGPYGIH